MRELTFGRGVFIRGLDGRCVGCAELGRDGELFDAGDVIVTSLRLSQPMEKQWRALLGQRVAQRLVVRLAVSQAAFAKDFDADGAFAVGFHLFDNRQDRLRARRPCALRRD